MSQSPEVERVNKFKAITSALRLVAVELMHVGRWAKLKACVKSQSWFVGLCFYTDVCSSVHFYHRFGLS